MIRSFRNVYSLYFDDINYVGSASNDKKIGTKGFHIYLALDSEHYADNDDIGVAPAWCNHI